MPQTMPDAWWLSLQVQCGSVPRYEVQENFRSGNCTHNKSATKYFFHYSLPPRTLCVTIQLVNDFFAEHSAYLLGIVSVSNIWKAHEVRHDKA